MVPQVIDIVGVGALNLDLITTARIQSGRGVRKLLVEEYHPDTETFLAPDRLEIAQKSLGLVEANDGFLGGSAFNTIRALSSLSQEFVLGFVGVAGRTGLSAINTGNEEPTFEQWFKNHRVESLIRTSNAPSGKCISVVDAGRRELRTTPGANLEAAIYFADNVNEIARYLARSRIVHVTSFLDPLTPEKLRDALKAAVQLNPRLLISIDPGYEWCKTQPNAVCDMIAMSEVLFVNQSEFRLLADDEFGSLSEEAAVMQIQQMQKQKSFPGPKSILVVKHDNEVGLWCRIGPTYVGWSYPHAVLDLKDITDATGAGDVFAAGLLAGLLIPGLGAHGGVRLGQQLASHKMKTWGTAAYTGFAAQFRDFTEKLGEQAHFDRTFGRTPSVFTAAWESDSSTRGRATKGRSISSGDFETEEQRPDIAGRRPAESVPQQLTIHVNDHSTVNVGQTVTGNIMQTATVAADLDRLLDKLLLAIGELQASDDVRSDFNAPVMQLQAEMKQSKLIARRLKIAWAAVNVIATMEGTWQGWDRVQKLVEALAPKMAAVLVQLTSTIDG